MNLAPVPVTNGLLEGLLFSPLPKCLSSWLYISNALCFRQSSIPLAPRKRAPPGCSTSVFDTAEIKTLRNVKVRDWYVLYGEFGENDQIVTRYL